MSPRTSQLQIRVSPAEKAALKRLASLSGQTVSAYVLAQALPAATHAMDAALKDLRAGPHEQAAALAALRRTLVALSPLELVDRLQSVSVADLTPLMQNRVAALVEEIAHHLGVDPPTWVAAIPPLDHPHFRWPLRSLRPYQLRVSPLSLKRRNVFDPSPVGEEPAPTPGGPGVPLGRLQALDRQLAILELDVEFYFIGGAILHQTFAMRPATVRPHAMFKPSGLLAQATEEVARSQAWPATWLEDALREILRPGPRAARFIDLRRLKAFRPPPEYALAIKVAAAASPIGAREVDDLRFLLRSLNLTTADAALAVVTRYFAERYLPPDAPAMLDRLLSE